jgi:hypothetical protein
MLSNAILKKLADSLPWPTDVETCHAELKEQYVFVRQASVTVGNLEYKLQRAKWCLFQANRLYREILDVDMDLGELNEHEWLKATCKALEKIHEHDEVEVPWEVDDAYCRAMAIMDAEDVIVFDGEYPDLGDCG